MSCPESRASSRPPRSARGLALSKAMAHPLASLRDERPVKGTRRSAPPGRRRPRAVKPAEPEFVTRSSKPASSNSAGPEGPSRPRPGWCPVRAIGCRRCVRPTSAIHVSKTSTPDPHGYGDRSPPTTRFTPRGPLRPARPPTLGAIRPSWPDAGRDSDASVAIPRPRQGRCRRNHPGRFPCPPVKAGSCHDPRRLPPPSGSPRAGEVARRFRRPTLAAPFAWCRSPGVG